MRRGRFAVLAVLALWLILIWGEAATPAAEPILSGPLVKLDIKSIHLKRDTLWYQPLNAIG
jgi:hypothetical protein